MKKTAFTIVVFVILVALALVFLQKGGEKHALTAADIAPADTVVLLHLPDLQRSELRWPQTGLAKIAAEPEVQAFLEKPRSKVPDLKQADDALGKLGRAQPGEVFLAVTKVTESDVKFLAGVAFNGTPADVQALLAPRREDLHRALNSATPGHVTYGKAEIDTLTAPNMVLAETMHSGWWLVANDLDSLKGAIDRVDGKSAAAAQSLAHDAQFKSDLATVPKDSDFELFADAGTLSRILLPMIEAGGAPIPAEGRELLRQPRVLAYAVKMDGLQMRESLFIANPGGKAQAQLPLHPLALSTAATAVVISNLLPADSALNGSTQSMLSSLPGFSDLTQALTNAGMKPEELGKVFGPEFGAVLDWPANESAPSFALTLDLRDAAKAKAAAAALAAGSDAWAKSEHAGALVLSQKAGGPLGLLQPTIALGDKFAILGFSVEGVDAVLDRAAAPQGRLDTVPAYQSATKLVAIPTSSFAYIDFKALFERTYGMLRPLALLALALQPEAGQYIDAGKLPNTATIAQHLGPIVFSNSTNERGTLIESSGPLTMSQLGAIFGGAVAGVASSGQVKPGGMLDPGALGLPIPNFLAPKPATPALPPLPDPPKTPDQPQ